MLKLIINNANSLYTVLLCSMACGPGIANLKGLYEDLQGLYIIDTEFKASTRFRVSKARGCSIPRAAGVLRVSNERRSHWTRYLTD